MDGAGHGEAPHPHDHGSGKSAQDLFRAAVGRADAIANAAKALGRNLTAEEMQAQRSAIKEAQALQVQLESDTILQGLKNWSSQSQGSFVGGSFMGEDVSGASLSGYGITTDQGRANGELTVNEDKNLPDEYKFMAQEKLKAMKSGAYKDAFVERLRAKAADRRFNPANIRDSAMKAMAMKVMQEGIDTSGGAWVPPDIRTDLIQKMATVPGVYNDVYKFTVGSDLVTFPVMRYTGDVDLYTSGVKPAWSVEAPSSVPTETTNPISGIAELRVWVLTAWLAVTRSQLEDNIFDLLGHLTNQFGTNFPLFINNAYIQGDGVGKPLGILVDPLASTAYASNGMQVLSGTSNTLSWGDEAGLDSATQGVLGTEASLGAQYETGAKWYAKKQSYATLRGMVDGVGRSKWASYDGYAPYVNGYPGSLIGYPIVKDQFMDAVGDGKHPLMLGNLSGYYAPQRVGLSVDVFREIYGLQDSWQSTRVCA